MSEILVNTIKKADGTGSLSVPAESGTVVVKDGSNDVTLNNITATGVYLGGTGAANYLDDYEEGTWTPTISCTNGNGTLSIINRAGYYVKTGNVVHANCYINFNKGTASGDVRVSGWPFTPRNQSQLYQVQAVALNGTVDGQLAEGERPYWGQLDPNDATFRMYVHRGDGTVDQMNAVYVGSNTDIRIQATIML